MITPKIRQKDFRDQKIHLCIGKSVVAISNLADELIKCKNDKNLSEYRQTYRSLTKISKDVMALLAHTNSQLTHQQRFALVNNLDKTYQQLAKNVPPGLERVFGDDLTKRIQGIKNNKQLFEKEKIYHSNQKSFKIFPQNPGNHYQKGYQQHQSNNH